MKKLMRNVQLTEKFIRKIANEVLNEVIYGTDRDDTKKTISVRYEKNKNTSKRREEKLSIIETELMDNISSSDTYTRELKCGLTAFNITKIKSEALSKFFKCIFEGCDTIADIDGEKYKLIMERPMIDEFFNTFIKKIEKVIEYHGIYNGFTGGKDPEKIYIYPVKSSKNFNSKIAEMLLGKTIHGLKIEILDTNALKKTINKAELDDDFIERNSEYYNNPVYNGNTVKDYAISAIEREKTKYRITQKLLSLNPKLAEIRNCYNKIKALEAEEPDPVFLLNKKRIQKIEIEKNHLSNLFFQLSR